MSLHFILFENQTVSQFLKRSENEYHIKAYKPAVAKKLAGTEFVNDTSRIRLVNWLVKELITQDVSEENYQHTISNWWGNIKDWFLNNQTNGELISSLNNFDFTYEDAIEKSNAWKMKKNKNPKGASGRVVVNLNSVSGFAGWTWVALDKAYCEEEGNAMGHCGNQGSENEKENILSLRDPNDVPHLTFINYGGALGEMKGRGNSKPTKKYHPAIIALLLSDEIGTIRGGGYMEQKNFSFQDLTPEQQKFIKEKKPWITNPEYFSKNREKLIKVFFIKNKAEKILKADSKSEEQTRNAVRDAINYNPSIWDMGRTQEANLVSKRKNLENISYFLKIAYTKSKKMKDPEDYFRWLDIVIQEMVKVIITKDYESINAALAAKKLAAKTNKNEFEPQLTLMDSNLIWMDQYIMALYKEQPKILQVAPKRNRFSSFEEYMENLRLFLDQYGYVLPDYKSNSNMISYEFLVKAGQEIAKQGKEYLNYMNSLAKPTES